MKTNKKLSRRDLLTGLGITGAALIGTATLANVSLSGGKGINWNKIISQPCIIVTPNGPIDGGDFGPNTPGTISSGIQEALDSGPTVLVRRGNYSGEITVNLNSANVLQFEQGVEFTGSINVEITNIAGQFGLLGGIPIMTNDTADVAGQTIVNSITVNALTTSVDALFVSGLAINQITTNNEPSSNDIGIGQVWFEGCTIGHVQINNYGSPEFPASMNFTRCYIGNETPDTGFITGAAIGQTTFDNCIIVFWANNQSLLSLTGLSTQVHIYNSNIEVDNLSVAGCSIVNLENGGQVYSLVMDGAYIEDHSPLALLRASMGWACNAEFSKINYCGESNEKLLSIMSPADATYFHNSSIILRDIGFGNTGDNAMSIGDFPNGMFTPNMQFSCYSVQGVTSQGWNVETPPVPMSGQAQQNLNPYTVRIFITTAGAVSMYTITDSNGTTQAFEMGFTAGQVITLDPGAKIAFTYDTAPGWKWYGV